MFARHFSPAFFLLCLTAVSCGKAAKSDDASSSDVLAAPGAIGFSQVTGTGFTLNWIPIAKAPTPAKDIQYQAIISKSQDAIATVELATQAKDSVLFDWTKNISSFSVTGLAEVTTYFVTVLAKDGDGAIVQYRPQGVITADMTAPIAGTPLVFTQLTPTSMTVSWGAAKDSQTDAFYLGYKLVKASRKDQIDTLAKLAVLPDSFTVMDWKPHVTTVNLTTGFTAGTDYWFALVVEDTFLNQTLYEVKYQPTPDLRKIFLTDRTYTGNLGGIAGADAKCNADPRKPANKKFRALLADGVNRFGCTVAGCQGETLRGDGLLHINYIYQRLDLDALNMPIPVGVATAAGVFPFPLKNSIGLASASAWTGLEGNWLTSSSNCSGWTYDQPDQIGAVANDSSAVGMGAISQGTRGCDQQLALYCIE